MKKCLFEGSGVALVTPFDGENNLNAEKFRELIEWQIENGTDALIVCGTTGEASTLTEKEQYTALKIAVDQAHGRLPVIAGTGSNDTRKAIEKSKVAKECGVNGLLIVTPHYNKATQKGLILHYNAIADSADLPIIVYNVPSRTGVNIKPETYAALAKNEKIVGIKEANGDISALAKTVSLCGSELTIYSGNDDQIVPILALGGKGVISVMANIIPRQTHDICELYFTGHEKAAAKAQTALIPLIESLFLEVNPIPVKTALDLMGMDVGNVRLPLCGMEEKNLAVLRQTLSAYHLI